MRFQRIAGLLAVATVAVALLAPVAANAAPYPAEPPTSTVSDGTVPRGGAVTFRGSGFLPFEKVAITVDGGSRLTVTADKYGAFSIEVPLADAGNATLKAMGLTSGVTVSQDVEVLGSSGNGNDDDNDNTSTDNAVALPTTGPSGTPLLLAVTGGMGSILLGAVILLFARGRRRDPNG